MTGLFFHRSLRTQLLFGCLAVCLSVTLPLTLTGCTLLRSPGKDKVPVSQNESEIHESDDSAEDSSEAPSDEEISNEWEHTFRENGTEDSDSSGTEQEASSSRKSRASAKSRKQDSETAQEEERPRKKAPKGFLYGGLSSEARAIEDSLYGH